MGAGRKRDRTGAFHQVEMPDMDILSKKKQLAMCACVTRRIRGS